MLKNNKDYLEYSKSTYGWASPIAKNHHFHTPGVSPRRRMANTPGSIAIDTKNEEEKSSVRRQYGPAVVRDEIN
ncbi:hypothetical protein CVT25_000585 [Psilocybe cyanescens]|uniref:Uncharacterized protein n=1 Tax=Psilocybe cyanescens TaxID=93625 RepID=A0A409WZZ9_PSICY|nr:hypothetical protein CVT25_000585 [Psilocybe cyanescens]